MEARLVREAGWCFPKTCAPEKTLERWQMRDLKQAFPFLSSPQDCSRKQLGAEFPHLPFPTQPATGMRVQQKESA